MFSNRASFSILLSRQSIKGNNLHILIELVVIFFLYKRDRALVKNRERLEHLTIACKQSDTLKLPSA